jgi:fructokinase
VLKNTGNGSVFLYFVFLYLLLEFILLFQIKTRTIMEAKRYVVGLGEALWDKNELKGEKNLGGAPLNFSFHAAQWLDMDTVIVVSALGADEDGDELNRELNKKELPQVRQIETKRTGVVLVTYDKDGKPSYNIKEDVAYDYIPFDEETKAIAQNCRAVCFGSLAQRSPVSRETIREFLDNTPSDCKKIFDINLRQKFYSKDIIEESLQRCNILKINDNELIEVSRMFGYSNLSFESRCWAILNHYKLEMLLLTCAENGSYVFTPGLMSFQDTPVVKDPKTVGAGDSFTGSFVAAILCGKSVIDAHKRAVEVSAFVCSKEEAMPPIPEWLLNKYK